MTTLLSELQVTESPEHRDSLNEMLFRVQSHEEVVQAFKAYQVIYKKSIFFISHHPQSCNIIKVHRKWITLGKIINNFSIFQVKSNAWRNDTLEHRANDKYS